MNKGRLLELAAFLDDVPDEAFNMRNWVASEATKPEGDVKGDCGFAGCAIGWAIHADLVPGMTFNEITKEEAEKSVIPTRLRYFPKYEGWTGFHAVAKAYEITPFEAEGLFDTGGYWPRPIKPAHVAAKIRAFVSGQHNGKDTWGVK